MGAGSEGMCAITSQLNPIFEQSADPGSDFDPVKESEALDDLTDCIEYHERFLAWVSRLPWGDLCRAIAAWDQQTFTLVCEPAPLGTQWAAKHFWCLTYALCEARFRDCSVIEAFKPLWSDCRDDFMAQR